MSPEEIERRYAKGYDYTDREHRNQLYNDMEWLMDEVETLKKLLDRSEKARWKTANNLIKCRQKLREIKDLVNP